MLVQALALSVDLISNGGRLVTEDGTHRQRILTEVYCLGSVESIFATCEHIEVNLLLQRQVTICLHHVSHYGTLPIRIIVLQYKSKHFTYPEPVLI